MRAPTFKKRAAAFLTLPGLLAVSAIIMCPQARAAEATAFLTVQAQGIAPNQIVTLSTGAKQQLQARSGANGTVSFNNLKYVPSTNLAFALSYSVKGPGVKTIPNNILMELNPFTGTVGMKGNATKAASVIINVASEDSQALIANQNGYFAGSADSLSGFSEGNLRVKASIINVEESCCPRALTPFAPVSISITGQPAKKAEMKILETTETASFEIMLPEYSYGVSVPDNLVDSTWVKGVLDLGNKVVNAVQRQTTSHGTLLTGQTNTDAVKSLQKGAAGAAINYLPSEQLCRYGSLAQGLASSEALNRSNKMALMSSMQGNEMGAAGSLRNDKNYQKIVMERFKIANCDPADANSALKCKKNGNAARYNKDVDYTSAFDAPLTLGINFSDGTSGDQENDMTFMAENLFPSKPINKSPDQEGYMNNSAQFRSLQAIRAVAKNTFVSQMAEKSRGTAKSAQFIRKLMESLGVTEEQAKMVIDDNPSYYAQMEILTKKIFQDPAFYINLIDTPANVARQKAAIRAIKLQQQNDFAQVVKRREMLLAVLLEMKLRERSAMVEQRLRAPNDKAEAE